MSDSISRQAALDALRNINAIVSPISDDVLLIDKAEAMTKLMLLPSAQPSDEYSKGWHDGRKALREEMWEDGRDRLD